MIKLWKHQEPGRDAILTGNHMLAMGMGTGKTRAVLAGLTLALKPKDWALVVCPASVVPAWGLEVKKTAEEYIDVLELLPGIHTHKKAKALLNFTRWTYERDKIRLVVVNYESVWRGHLGEAMKLVPWDWIIADESHRIKKVGGVASLFLYKLGKTAKRRLPLTGTPMPHSPLDLYSQFRFMDWTFFNKSYTEFKAAYTILGGKRRPDGSLDPTPGKSFVIGYKNLDKLNEIFERHAYVVKPEDVQDLPEQIDITIPCALSEKGMKAYKQMTKTLAAEVEAGIVTAANAMVKILRLQQITSGVVTTTEGEEVIIDEAKRTALEDFLTDLDAKEPVVIFTRFKADMRVVKEVCAKLRGSEQVAELSGSANELALFQSGERSAIAVNIQSGSEGIDLTRANYALYYSCGLSLGAYLQSRKRIHRPGQSRTVRYYHCASPGTVDNQIYQGFIEKKKIIDSVTDGQQEAINKAQQEIMESVISGIMKEAKGGNTTENCGSRFEDF